MTSDRPVTDAFDWDRATPRDRDLWVAVYVMRTHELHLPPHQAEGSVRSYTTDARDDYCVLAHVRSEWLFGQRQRFAGRLHALWRSRPLGAEKPQAWPDCAMEYRPGDFSLAAYLALTRSDER